MLGLAAAQGAGTVALPQLTPTQAALLRAVDADLAGNHSAAAIARLQQALEQDPTWKEGWWRLGALWYENDNYGAAIGAFARLTKLDPTAGAPWVMVGLCEFEVHDYGLSLQHIEQGRGLGFPRNPDLSDVARYHQAEDLILTGNFQEAQTLLNGFWQVGKNPKNITVAQGLAALQIPITEIAASTLSTTYREVIKRVGQAQYEVVLRHGGAARAAFEKLIAQYPDFPSLHYAFGVALQGQGKIEAARAQFQAELAVSPEAVPARLQLAGLSLGSADAAPGIAYARAALKLAPTSAPGHYLLGTLLIQEHQLEAGAAEIEKSKDLDPGSSVVRYTLAQVYLRLHRRADALREQKEFLRLKPMQDSLTANGTLPASAYLSSGQKP